MSAEPGTAPECAEQVVTDISLRILDLADSRGAATDARTPHIELAVTATSNEPRVDTRLLARQLGNKHKPVIALIDKYLASFKGHGQVLFKKADGSRKQGGGMAERYALLNEDQAYFLLSLSRNTNTVVALKSKLVTAFGAARRAADIRKSEYLPGHHQLHDALHILANGSPHERHVHINANKLLNKFSGIQAGQRAMAGLPEQALLIVGQLVAASAVRGATDHHDGYRRIKTSLQALGAVVQLGVADGKRLYPQVHQSACSQT